MRHVYLVKEENVQCTFTMKTGYIPYLYYCDPNSSMDPKIPSTLSMINSGVWTYLDIFFLLE